MIAISLLFALLAPDAGRRLGACDPATSKH